MRKRNIRSVNTAANILDILGWLPGIRMQRAVPRDLVKKAEDLEKQVEQKEKELNGLKFELGKVRIDIIEKIQSEFSEKEIDDAKRALVKDVWG